MQILTLSRAICSDIFHSLSAPATLDGAQGSPCLATARARWPGPEPPSRQGAASESSLGSSASPLSSEIEFGLGEGGCSPPATVLPARASLPCLPQTKLVGKGRLAKGMGRGFEGSRFATERMIRTLRATVREAGCTWPRSHRYSLRWRWPLLLCLTIWSANKSGRGRWGNREVVRH